MRKAIIAVLSVILVFAAAIPVFSAKKPDIKINGDNQKIKIPTELVKQNQPNNIDNVKEVTKKKKLLST